MYQATIYKNDLIIAETNIESDDAFNCLTWAHRMGWDIIEVASTSAKLEKSNGSTAVLSYCKA